jgi:hypothetical protein
MARRRISATASALAHALHVRVRAKAPGTSGRTLDGVLHHWCADELGQVAAHLVARATACRREKAPAPEKPVVIRQGSQ